MLTDARQGHLARVCGSNLVVLGSDDRCADCRGSFLTTLNRVGEVNKY